MDSILDWLDALIYPPLESLLRRLGLAETPRRPSAAQPSLYVSDAPFLDSDPIFPSYCLDALRPGHAVVDVILPSAEPNAPLAGFSTLYRTSGDPHLHHVLALLPGHVPALLDHLGAHLARLSRLIVFDEREAEVGALVEAAVRQSQRTGSGLSVLLSAFSVQSRYRHFWNNLLPSLFLPFLAAVFLGMQDVATAIPPPAEQTALLAEWWATYDVAALKRLLALSRSRLLATFGLRVVDHYRRPDCIVKGLPWDCGLIGKEVAAQAMMDTGYLLLARPRMTPQERALLGALREQWREEVMPQVHPRWRKRGRWAPRPFALLGRRFYVAVYQADDIAWLRHPPFDACIPNVVQEVTGYPVEVRFIRTFNKCPLEDLDTPPTRPLRLPSFDRCEPGRRFSVPSTQSIYHRYGGRGTDW